ncbi:MAG: hypothetical protein P0Y58_05075 [Candidatus Pseudomonas phytovorans]|uniref:Uncharacterized protein n=1 Tax=Candidatus Pseudomonas phytovorans TaxID=3121377 RepID=A0AAJ5WJ11_9PSED|nr:hypothetical protein [Pseudomonas sp.]WEK31572.1 MAG: hypothetical protein P0Y58_05075 [Pseudomonas sp.]
MEIFGDSSEKATALLHRLGVHEVASEIWAFIDMDVASHGHVHHSQQPVALARTPLSIRRLQPAAFPDTR